ncbi:MAG: helix-turn-helix domain-containing protein [Planctomycetota bacterium]|jgi:AraC-like DNA-binding protein
MDIFSLLQKHKFQINNVIHCISDKPEGRIFPSQINRDSHLIHIIAGKGKFITPDIEFKISAGLTIFVPSFTEFTIQLDSASIEMINMHFKITLADNSNLEEHVILKPYFRAEDFSEIKEKMHKFNTLWRSKDMRAYTLGSEIVLNYFSDPQNLIIREKETDDRMSQLAEKLRSRDLKIYEAEKLAVECHLSVSQMNRRFRKKYRQSPQSYWDNHRFAAVVENLQLLDYEKSLGTLSEDYGFCDISYFSRWFKKLSGFSPLKYRQIMTGM